MVRIKKGSRVIVDLTKNKGFVGFNNFTRTYQKFPAIVMKSSKGAVMVGTIKPRGKKFFSLVVPKKTVRHTKERLLY